ncbi:nucleoid-associated protein [Hymenobacter fodinae]|uniref:Nucleoid-associated protein n=1 Tax=Hymenobacter fodinae TaxID=2510796 RepID=A0A4Z0P4V4_9BACT|nr:nucleoid-associated protein [Hymenobacter fodinae]TGE06301.1 nucleoid-associated protein [Hymenobacter fodinae]
MLTIKNIIVHNLHKEQFSTTTKVELSNSLLPINDSSQRLVEELNGRYTTQNRAKVTYAKFGTGTSFPSLFSSFHSNQCEEEFISFTQNAIVELEKIISTVPAAKGGYVVFSQFENNNDYVGIYIIREKNGVLFKRDESDGSFKINDTVHIDFEKIAMGCRINNTVYGGSTGNRYLSFIDSRKDEVSKFFNEWISTDNNTDNVSDTKNLHKVLNQIDPPLDENGLPISREDLLNKAFRIIKEQSRLVDLAQLSHALYGEPDHIATYIINSDIEMSGQFKADGKVLNKFATIKVAADNIVLSFPLKALNELVTISEEHPNLITIHSEALANKIRNENRSSQ